MSRHIHVSGIIHKHLPHPALCWAFGLDAQKSFRKGQGSELPRSVNRQGFLQELRMTVSCVNLAPRITREES